MKAAFGDLGFRQRRSLKRMMQTRSVVIGAELIRQGDTGTEWMVVLDGQAAVVVDGVHIRTVTAGGFFGELALLPHIARTQGVRTASVVAVGPTTVGVIDQESFQEVMDRFPQVGGRILAQAWSLTADPTSDLAVAG